MRNSPTNPRQSAIPMHLAYQAVWRHSVMLVGVMFAAIMVPQQGSGAKSPSEMTSASNGRMRNAPKTIRGDVSVPRAIISIFSRPKKSPAKRGLKSIVILIMSGAHATTKRQKIAFCLNI